jgi:hypothetical protein
MKVWEVEKKISPNFQGMFWHLLKATRHISCLDTALAHDCDVSLLLRRIRSDRFEITIKVVKR